MFPSHPISSYRWGDIRLGNNHLPREGLEVVFSHTVHVKVLKQPRANQDRPPLSSAHDLIHPHRSLKPRCPSPSQTQGGQRRTTQGRRRICQSRRLLAVHHPSLTRHIRIRYQDEAKQSQARQGQVRSSIPELQRKRERD